MIDALGTPFQRYLADHRHGVLIGNNPEGPSSLLVPYQAQGLQIDCLLPLWAELTYRLEQDRRLTLVIPTLDHADCWLQVHGIGQFVRPPAWSQLLPQETSYVAPEDLYCVIRVHPCRLDLYDGRCGWGARETLELTP